MEIERRYRSLEWREAGDRVYVSGEVLVYGDVAEPGGLFREQFRPGAFGGVAGLDVLANLQHSRSLPLGRTGGGGLELSDSAAALSASLALPDTSAGRDAAALLRAGVLRGWSVEFRPKQVSIVEGIRIVNSADLVGLALVDRPAYGQSLAAIAERMAARPTGKRYVVL